MLFTFSFFALFSTLLLGSCTPDADEVKSIPGFDGTVNFKHYSGYLDSTKNSHIHYWFFESQRNPSEDPLVLWLNGGPGCSSVLGALSEHGPFTLTKDKKVVLNQYAWNMQANVLYIESPAGVGFSYNDNGDFKTGDNETAQQNYQALVSFLGKFPQYEENDFYVTGESYGGIYVPTLSKLVKDSKYPKNFIGFAIGNGLLDNQLNFVSQLYFFFYHGIIDTTSWDGMINACCPAGTNLIDGRYCDFSNPPSQICSQRVNAVQDRVNKMPLNLYDIYDVCDNSGVEQKFPFPVLHPESVDRSRMLLNSPMFPNHFAASRLGDNPPCVNFNFMVDWINQQSVKDALHISPKALPWSPCSPEVNQNYVTEYSTMNGVVRNLLDSGLRGMIYNGDIDSMCNYFGDEIFSTKLGYKAVKEYQPWMVDSQIAGMVKFYPNYAFVTIRGAGHTVPMYKPKEAQVMFNTFLTYKGDMVDGL